MLWESARKLMGTSSAGASREQAVHGLKYVRKVWGRELWLVNNEQYCAKYLYLDPGFACSLHRHPIKNETFVVLRGSCQLEFADSRRPMGVYDSQRIAAGTWHRFSNPGNQLCIILEVSTHHDDLDVERKEESKSLSSAPRPQAT